MRRACLAAAVLIAGLAGGAHADTFSGRPLVITDGRAGAAPAPLVLALHGFTGSAARFRAKTNFDALAARDGFVVAYPSGLRQRWNDGAIARDGPDDVAYLRALLRHLVAQGIADPTRIYLVGHSNGGGMALRMACAHPDLVAGIAVIAMTTPRAAPCPHGIPLPAFFIHGIQDPIVPAAGLPPKRRYGGALSLKETLKGWAVRNRCATPPARSMPDPKTSTTYDKYRRCAAPLYLLRIADHGHEWPGADARARWLQGPASLRVDAADVAWRFFKAL